MRYVLRLADNETFTNLAGCQIIAVPADWDNDRFEAALDPESVDYEMLKVVVTFATGDEV